MKTKVVKVPFEIEIPHHWTLVSNREIFEEHNIRGLTNLDLLSVSQSRGKSILRKTVIGKITLGYSPFL